MKFLRFSNGVSVGISQCGWSNEIFDRAKKKNEEKKNNRETKKRKKERTDISIQIPFLESEKL